MIYINNFILKIKKNIFLENNNYLFNTISLVFVFLPITLITGPFLPDFFLTIIALYFLVISIKKKLFSYYQNPFVVIFFCFYLYLLLVGVFSYDPYSSLIKSNGPIFYFRYLFFVLGCWYLLDRNSNLINYFFVVSLFLVLFVIFDGLVQWVSGSNLFGFERTRNRIPGIFKDEEILGHFLSHITPIVFALMLYILKFKKKQITFIMLFLIFNEVFIFITNDRSAFLKFFQFTLLMMLLSNRFKIFRVVSFLISLILISLILYFSSFSQLRYIKTLEAVQSNKIPFMPWTPGHEQIFNLSIDFFLQNPLFGNGSQYFKYTCFNQPELIGCNSHPHNYYFQTLAELGFVGFGFLLIAFFYLFFILTRQFLNVWIWKKDKYFIPDYLVALYSIVFLFLWPLIPTASFYNNWVNVLVYLPIPFILYFRKQLKKI